MSLNELSTIDIQNKIYEIRGCQVMIDSDLALLYEVGVKALNQAVKRNTGRFPKEFMFQLSEKEYTNLRSQFVTAKSNWSKKRYVPYAFTEQGVAMLSAILKSPTAIKVSIRIMAAFVEMRHYLMKNADIFEKFHRIDQKLIAHDDNFNKIFKALESKELPKQGIFFNGQVFDAHVFVSDLVKKAEKSIILIDNYVDEKVLTLLSKKKSSGVEVYIYSKNITNKIRQDADKFNTQYKNLILKQFNDSHDRFLIIDNKDLYHIGASLKDLGKKWFAFSKLKIGPNLILDKLKCVP